MMRTEDFLKNYDIEVVFCCFSEYDAKIYEELLKG